jgi:hypothetical protein
MEGIYRYKSEITSIAKYFKKIYKENILLGTMKLHNYMQSKQVPKLKYKEFNTN